MIRSRKIFCFISIGILLLFLAPLFPLWVGTKFFWSIDRQQEMSTNVKSYQRAYWCFKASLISPLSWRYAKSWSSALGERMALAMRSRVSTGTLTSRDIEQYKAFLLSSGPSKEEAVRQLTAMGSYEEALAEAGAPRPAPFAGLAALAALSTGDRELTAKWLTFSTTFAPSNLLLGLGLYDRLYQQLETQPENSIDPWLRAEVLRRQGDTKGARDLLRPFFKSGDCLRNCQYVFALALNKAHEDDFKILTISLLQNKPTFSDSGAWFALASQEFDRGENKSGMVALTKALEGISYRIFRSPIFDFKHFPAFPAELVERSRHHIEKISGSQSDLNSHALKDLQCRLLIIEGAISIAVADGNLALARFDEAEALGITLPQIATGRIMALEILGKWNEADGLAEKSLTAWPDTLSFFKARHAFIDGDFAQALKFTSPYSSNFKDRNDPMYSEANDIFQLSSWMLNQTPLPHTLYSMQPIPHEGFSDQNNFRAWFMDAVDYASNLGYGHHHLLLGILKGSKKPNATNPGLGEIEGISLLAYHQNLRNSPFAALRRNQLLFWEMLRSGDSLNAQKLSLRIERIRKEFFAQPKLDITGFDTMIFGDAK